MSPKRQGFTCGTDVHQNMSKQKKKYTLFVPRHKVCVCVWGQVLCTACHRWEAKFILDTLHSSVQPHIPPGK